MNKNSPFIRFLQRSSGPAISVLAHILLFYALLHFLVFSSSSTTPDLETKLVQDEQLELDDIKELDPIEPLQDLNDDVISESDTQPLLDDIAQKLADVTPETPSMVDELPSILPSDSPLTFKALGGDSQSMGTLKGRYGSRATENGLLGSYFANVDFTGPILMRIDETLNKNWGESSPWPGRVKPDLFSVIWTGRIVPKRSGHYTLYLQSDDGARMWINDKLVLDQLTEHPQQEDKVQIEMLAGLSYDVKYAFCEVFVHAVSRLEWSSEDAGIQRQLVPTDCMWADGISTRELLKWNEQQGGNYVNRKKMRNPALLDNIPYSHIVNYKTMDEGYLQRVQLLDLVQDFKEYKRTGKAPSSFRLPSGRDETPARVANESSDDVEIDIF